MSYVSEIRSKVGTDTLILVGVCALIGFENKILLQKRADNNEWGLPGGLMEIGETVEETLRREVMEEIGVSILKSTFFGIYSNRPVITYSNGDQSQPVGIFFFCTIEGKAKVRDETLDLRYFSQDNLPNNIFFIHKEPILDFFDGKRNIVK